MNVVINVVNGIVWIRVNDNSYLNFLQIFQCYFISALSISSWIQLYNHNIIHYFYSYSIFRISTPAYLLLLIFPPLYFEFIPYQLDMYCLISQFKIFLYVTSKKWINCKIIKIKHSFNDSDLFLGFFLPIIVDQSRFSLST